MKEDGVSQKLLFQRTWSELSEVELLSVILSGGTGPPVLDRARALLEQVGSAGAIGGLTLRELRGLGLTESQAIALLAADTLFRRVACVPLVRGHSYGCSREVFDYFRPQLSHLRKECFWVLLLDGKNRLLRAQRIAEGSLTAALAHPREVYRPAIQEAAASLICVHNHPSGDPNPSSEDVELTRRLAETGRVVGIRMLDHVVVSDQGYFSFADQGMV